MKNSAYFKPILVDVIQLTLLTTFSVTPHNNVSPELIYILPRVFVRRMDLSTQTEPHDVIFIVTSFILNELVQTGWTNEYWIYWSKSYSCIFTCVHLVIEFSTVVSKISGIFA